MKEPSDPSVPQPEAGELVTSSAKGQEKDIARARREGWREIADFFVSFGFAVDPEGEERLRTKAHHSQADEDGEWEGVVTEELVNWMLRQASLPVPPKLPIAKSQIEPHFASVTPPSIQIEALEVQVSESATLLDVRQKKLTAEIHFRVSGPKAEELAARQVPFRIEIYSVNLPSGASTLLASETGQMQPRNLEYALRREFPLPDAGRYELHSIVLVLPPAEMVAFHKGPVFRVIP